MSGPSAADAHRMVSEAFTARCAAVTEWDVPSPVPEWTARDVVRHLTQWLPGLLAGGSTVRLPQTPSVEDDPLARWQAQAQAVQALLDDEQAAAGELSNPNFGRTTVGAGIEQFYVPDVFMHTWDLARATGQDDRLDPGFAAALLSGMESMEEMLRSSGQFGMRQAVHEDADPTDRLMAFVGRDPYWARPGAPS